MTGWNDEMADVFTSSECFELVRALFIRDDPDGSFPEKIRSWPPELDSPPARHHNRRVDELK